MQTIGNEGSIVHRGPGGASGSKETGETKEDGKDHSRFVHFLKSKYFLEKNQEKWKRQGHLLYIEKDDGVNAVKTVLKQGGQQYVNSPVMTRNWVQ